MTDTGPFHEGERAVQRRAGESSQADLNGRIVGDSVPRGALSFLARQEMLVVGRADDAGAVWASVWQGDAGFVHATDARTVRISLPRGTVPAEDPVRSSLRAGSRLGTLAIELGTRRRLRINGTVTAVEDGALRLEVDAAFPNCPKYVQRRQPSRRAGGGETGAGSRSGMTLEPGHVDLVRTADTFFVATTHAAQGVDASHRGGPPGFVEVREPGVLVIPDYRGNGMFNTLGNLEVDPRAGLVFPSFESGRLLHLTGRARLHWDRDDPDGRTGGTSRFWEFEPDRWIETRPPVRTSWKLLDASPYNPPAPRRLR